MLQLKTKMKLNLNVVFDNGKSILIIG